MDGRGEERMAEFARHCEGLASWGHATEEGRCTLFSAAEYVRRRTVAWGGFPTGSVAVVAAGAPRFMTQLGGVPIPHPSGYRPHADFLWLTGCEDQGAVAVLEAAPPGARTPGGVRLSLVFGAASRKDLAWDNAPEAPESVARRCGAEACFSGRGDLDHVLSEARARAGGHFRLFYDPGVNPEVHGGGGGAHGSGFPDYQVRSAVLGEWVRGVGPGGVRCEDPAGRFGEARWAKGEEEVGAMRAAARATGQALVRTMMETSAGESEVAAGARFEYEARQLGATRFAYPPCVGAGKRSAVIHAFPTGRRPMRAGELLLMDAGACVEGYAADITRTWALPAAGARGPAPFSASQALVYAAVLRTHEQLLQMCVPGVTMGDLNSACRGLLAEELMALGWIDAPSEVARFFPHIVTHSLGMDVHDSAKLGDTGMRPLSEGVAITVEPGLYVSPWEQDALRRRPQARATDFVGGIRIEDDLVIRGRAGPEVLSDFVPRSIEALEALHAIHA